MFGIKTETAFLAVSLCLVSVAIAEDFNPFASRVIDISLNAPYDPNYLPAPGQRINLPFWNNTSKALGAPIGGGSATPNNDDVVTLGGFGGQIVLAFDHNVGDCPANPMGLDAIVFTNTFWLSGNPQWHWAELATIEIMPELNGNTTAGDDPNEKWYLIPGSHLTDNSSYRVQSWYRYEDSGYPAYTNWPDSYQTAAHELSPILQTVDGKEGTLVNPNYNPYEPNDPNNEMEGYWGYAEYTPSLKPGDRNGDNITTGLGDCPDMPIELFYTTPDNPMIVGISAGSCGGDAFDIQWAVDANTWESANLSSFRYIRLTTAVDERQIGDEGVLGEMSAEIDAAADVRPTGDIDGDSSVGFTDLGLFADSWLSQWGQENFNPAADLAVDNKIDFKDYALFAWGWSQYNLQ
jgi:hypothetical protein